jgi:hypothetical protein
LVATYSLQHFGKRKKADIIQPSVIMNICVYISHQLFFIVMKYNNINEEKKCRSKEKQEKDLEEKHLFFSSLIAFSVIIQKVVLFFCPFLPIVNQAK